MNIHMIGAGALGLLFAAKCADTNGGVGLITRSIQQSELISEKGIHFQEGYRQSTIPINCLSFEQLNRGNLHILPAAHVDWVFLFVKQQHIGQRLIAYLKRYTAQETPILCFQNGIGHIETLQKAIPMKLIYTAITTEAALKQSEHHVIHTGKGETWIGHEGLERNMIQEKEQNLRKYLENAGFTVNSSKNIKRYVWKKLLINAVINPLTAILRVKNGELISSPYWISVMKALYDEGRAVADSLQIECSEELWDQLINVCKTTALNTSSMLQDIHEARMTEVEWINGAIIRIAKQRQIEVPTHQAIYRIIKGMESASSFTFEK